MRGIGKTAARHGVRGARVAARRAADAEVDAAGIERLQHAERFCNAKCAVVRQQDAAGAYADSSGLSAQACHQHFRAWIAERGDGVMLGEPVALVAELVRAPGERERLLDRAPRVVAA